MHVTQNLKFIPEPWIDLVAPKYVLAAPNSNQFFKLTPSLTVNGQGGRGDQNHIIENYNQKN
jgi:hypothetical protein